VQLEFGNLYLRSNVVLSTPVSIVGGQLGGSGNLTLNGMVDWEYGELVGSGVTTFGSNSVVNIMGEGNKGIVASTINNLGTVVWTGRGSIDVSQGGVFNNLPGALFDAQADAWLYRVEFYTEENDRTPVFNNAGRLRQRGVTNTTWFNGIHNTGTLEIDDGILAVAGLLSNAPSSHLAFQIPGRPPEANYGQLLVEGVIRLDGTLEVGFTNNYVPKAGDDFRLANWQSHSGGFAQVSGLALGGGLFLQAICDDEGLTLSTRTSVPPPPLPLTNLVDQVVALGRNAVFTIEPAGPGPFTFQWQFNGTNLMGQTNASLILTNVPFSSGVSTGWLWWTVKVGLPLTWRR